MSYIQSAFEAVCKSALQAEDVYVCLMERSSFYGGPEEGGWWGEDVALVAHQQFDTREQAEAAREDVETLAEELEAEARKSFGDQCLREMDWCEARGLEADWLPEPDGPSEFTVCVVTDGLPQSYRGCRQYS